MKIIWRQKGQSWEMAAEKTYRNEEELQELVCQTPAIIPFEDISKDILPPAVMIREANLPGSGSTDIIGVDERGGITVIECKLATNPEIKRKVIGQVLEYAAFLWKKPYDFVDEIAKRRLGKSLAAAVRQCLEEESREDWEEAVFMSDVTNTLQSGTFQLIVAVDEVNEELRRTIEYLAQGPSHLAIYALGIGYFSSDQREILVPHLYGVEPRIKPPQGSKQWTSERFFQDAESRKLPDSVVKSMEGLLEFSDDAADRVFWGMGREIGSFTFHLLKDGQTNSLYSVHSDGRLSINFGWLKEKLPVGLIERYWQELKKIDGLRKMAVREDFNCWPSAKLADVFKTEEDMQKFQQAVLTLKEQIAAL